MPDVGVRLAARAPRVVRGVTRRGHTLQAGKLQGREGREARSVRHEYCHRIHEFEFEYERNSEYDLCGYAVCKVTIYHLIRRRTNP